ncbi:MAG TPA: hypothetical protein VL096_05145, partial [Pirellulaceae bacterium]|nr:hypothetical protein [Pirellulaceae bacterium]
MNDPSPQRPSPAPVETSWDRMLGQWINAPATELSLALRQVLENNPQLCQQLESALAQSRAGSARSSADDATIDLQGSPRLAARKKLTLPTR